MKNRTENKTSTGDEDSQVIVVICCQTQPRTGELPEVGRADTTVAVLDHVMIDVEWPRDATKLANMLEMPLLGAWYQ